MAETNLCDRGLCLVVQIESKKGNHLLGESQIYHIKGEAEKDIENSLPVILRRKVFFTTFLCLKLHAFPESLEVYPFLNVTFSDLSFQNGIVLWALEVTMGVLRWFQNNIS